MDRASATAAGSGAEVAPAPRFFVPHPATWRLRSGSLDLGRFRVMGILNTTPDSFSDGGELVTVEAAVDRAATMVADGADLLDVGGESTRPGAEPLSVEEELSRVVPVVAALAARFDVPLSVDTRSAVVARACVGAGASVVNDVSGLVHDPGMAAAVADTGAGVVLMHMRGDPATMGALARYGDVVADVRRELGGALDRARAAGVPDEAVVVDPGLGFAKTAAHNWEILGRLDELLALGRPLLVGPSRKRFLGQLLGVPPRERATGTAAACMMAYLLGSRIFRVHDVRPVVEALSVAEAVMTAGGRDLGRGRAP